jgi:hypothetical protein
MSPSTIGVFGVAVIASVMLLVGVAQWVRTRRLPDAEARRRVVRAQTRTQLRQPAFWVFSGCLYGVTFASVFVIMVVSGFVVPLLPWIPKPYVSPDPPPLITALYCANFLLGTWAVSVPFSYLFGLPVFLRKKDGREEKT